MPILRKTDTGISQITHEERAEVSLATSELFKEPTTTETLGAAFRVQNSFVSMANNLTSMSNNFKPVPGYDPLDTNKDDIKGYEGFATEFIKSESPEETALIKQRLDSEFKDRRTLAESGWLGFGAQMAAGVTDPIFIATMFMGTGQLKIADSMFKTAGRAALSAAVGESLTEVALHASQKTRTLEAINDAMKFLREAEENIGDPEISSIYTNYQRKLSYYETYSDEVVK